MSGASENPVAPHNSDELVVDRAFEVLIRDYTGHARGTDPGSPEWNFVELLNHVYGKVLVDRGQAAGEAP